MMPACAVSYISEASMFQCRAFLTCIVDEHIQLAELGLNMLFDSPDGLFIGHIDLYHGDESLE